jgi:hypothetical protein
MNKYLLSTSILSAALVATPVVKAEESYVHGAVIDASTKLSKNRKLAELNYMQPFFADENSLPIFDLKLKTDNQKSKEINLGLAYRHNLDDAAILGAYAYFDHRKTANNFSVSGLTAGVEFLSKYFDARANIYLPQNKRKKIAHNNTKTVEIRGNSIYALSGGHKYESSFRGYDLEVGTPLFVFSDDLNEKFGTKIYVARYSFTAKGVKPITGTRFRIAQDIFKTYIGDNSYNLYANAETQYDNVRERQNFVGLGLRVSFGDAQNRHKKKTGLSHRMMETIVRDVDIVTTVESEAPEFEDFYIGNNKVTRVLYVESGNHNIGTGTAANPYSAAQLAVINHDDAVVVEVNGGALTQAERGRLRNVLNGVRTVLSTRGKNPMSMVVDGTVGAHPTISSPDRSITEVKINGQATSMENGTRTVTFHTPPIRRIAELVRAAHAFRVPPFPGLVHVGGAGLNHANPQAAGANRPAVAQPQAAAAAQLPQAIQALQARITEARNDAARALQMAQGAQTQAVARIHQRHAEEASGNANQALNDLITANADPAIVQIAINNNAQINQTLEQIRNRVNNLAVVAPVPAPRPQAQNQPNGGAGAVPARNAGQLIQVSTSANAEALRLYNQAVAGNITVQEAEQNIRVQLDLVRAAVAEGQNNNIQPQILNNIIRNRDNIDQRLNNLGNRQIFAAAQVQHAQARAEALREAQQRLRDWHQRQQAAPQTADDWRAEFTRKTQQIIHVAGKITQYCAQIQAERVNIENPLRNIRLTQQQNVAENAARQVQQAAIESQRIMNRIALELVNITDISNQLEQNLRDNVPAEVAQGQITALTRDFRTARNVFNAANANAQAIRPVFEEIRASNEDLRIPNISQERRTAVHDAETARNQAQARNREIANLLIPAVNLENLTIEELRTYTIIAETAGSLQAQNIQGQGREYLQKQRDYEEAVGFLTRNNINVNLVDAQVQQEIADARGRRIDVLDLAENLLEDEFNRVGGQNLSVRQRQMARTMLRYEARKKYHNFGGAAQVRNNQQGIGFSGLEIKDFSIVNSFDALRERYGILNADHVKNMAKRFVIEQIKVDRNLPLTIADNVVSRRALDVNGTNPSQVYWDAVTTYLGNGTAQQKKDAKIVIDEAVRSSNTIVNNSMAAYRALDRMNNDVVYTDKIRALYNDREALAYSLVAILDVNETRDGLGHINAVEANAREIFEEQREKLKYFVFALGKGQRNYNFDRDGRVDLGGHPHIRDEHGSNSHFDDPTCPHGFFSRFIDTAAGHSLVVLNEAVPANFSTEFVNSLTRKIGLLPEAERREVINWTSTGQIESAIGANEEVVFRKNGGAPIPQHLATILTGEMQDLNARYRFASANLLEQVVDSRTALRVFDETINGLDEEVIMQTIGVN